jgi:spermidine dehydrogenase
VRITRRDYLNATLVGAGAALLRAASPGEQLRGAAFDGYSGVGDYSKANGNTWAVLTDGHTIRDHPVNPASPEIIDTDESFDCVVVGGGISGLAAALFFVRDSSSKGTGKRACLVIDDHPIFGGLAKRNEVIVGGRRVIANQASAMFFPPFAGTFLDRFYRSIGIDPHGFDYQSWSGREPALPLAVTPYFDGSRNSAFFFGPKFQRPKGLLLNDPWGKNLSGAPLTQVQVAELLRVHAGGEPALPKEHGDARSRYMDSITLEQFLMETYGISRDTVRTFLSPVAGGGAGIGADALSAYGEYAADVLLPWDESNGAQMFPGGNAGVARHILKALLPASLPGEVTMRDICRARVNFGALDRPQDPARVRLNSTVVSIANRNGRVEIIYLNDGRYYRVCAQAAIMAGGSWTARHIIADLPATHQEAYAQFHRSPCLVANIALRNWRFLYRAGIAECQWFEGIGNYFALRKLATIGDVSPVISPDSPVMLTLKILFSYPGMPLAEQNSRGRSELLSTTYREYERRLVSQLETMFRPLGFDAGRDLAAVILNRWGHAYLSAQPGFFFGTIGKPAPGEVLRSNPVGQVAFANSDLSGIMDHRASILEAQRAADQVRTLM